MKKKYLRVIVGILCWMMLGLSGCSVDPSVVMDEFRNQPDKIWEWKEVQSFDFDITDGNSYYDVSVQARITAQFAYSNLWMVYRLGSPDSLSGSALGNLGSKSAGSKQFDAVLADETGRWLGEGQGNLRVYSFPVIQRAVLKPGKYRFLLKQNVRVDQLFGVSDIGLRVVKSGAIL
jgi:gliding motility-associated lipoprotein GldH